MIRSLFFSDVYMDVAVVKSLRSLFLRHYHKGDSLPRGVLNIVLHE